MNHKIYTALIAIALGLGLYIGKTYYAKTETVEVAKEVTKNNVVTVTHEIVKADGSKEVTTTTTDKSVEHKDSKTSVTVAAPPLPAWHISVSASVQSLSNPAPVYGLQVEKRLLGPFSVGVRADTQKTIGVVVGFEF